MTFNGKELSNMTAKEISHVLVADTDKLTPKQRSWFKYLWGCSQGMGMDAN